MGCCCGCPGVACSECSGTPDKALFVSTSGITPVASGTCYNTPPINWPGRIDYTGVYQDGSGCLIGRGASGFPCNYDCQLFSVDLFSPKATSRAGTTSSTCAAVATLPPVTMNTTATLNIAGGVYTLSIASQSIGGNNLDYAIKLYFLGTQTIPGTPCRLTTPLVFTNSITSGNVYTVLDDTNTSHNYYAFASGGTATVAFQRSCCP